MLEKLIGKLAKKRLEQWDCYFSKFIPAFEKFTHYTKFICDENKGITDIKSMYEDKSFLKDKEIQSEIRKLRIYCGMKILTKQANKNTYLLKSASELFQNKPKDAIYTLEEYLEINPTDPEPYDMMATIYKMMGKHEEAQKNWGISRRMEKYE